VSTVDSFVTSDVIAYAHETGRCV